MLATEWTWRETEEEEEAGNPRVFAGMSWMMLTQLFQGSIQSLRMNKDSKTDL